MPLGHAPHTSSARKARARTAQALTVANSYIVNNNTKFEASFRRLFPKTWDALQRKSESGALWAIANECAKYGIGPYGRLSLFKAEIKKMFRLSRKAHATVQKQQYHKKQVNKHIKQVAVYHRKVPTRVWKSHYSKAWPQRRAMQRAFDEGPDGYFGKARAEKRKKITELLARSGGQKRGRGPDDHGQTYFTSDGRKIAYADGEDLGPAEDAFFTLARAFAT